MTGSIQVKNGKWYIVLSYKNPEGKWKTKWVKTGLLEKNNKRKAELLLDKTLEEFQYLERDNAEDSGHCVEGKSIIKLQDKISTAQASVVSIQDTEVHEFAEMGKGKVELEPDILVVELLEKWLQRTKLRVGDNTWIGYKYTITGHLIPYFTKNRLRVSEVTSDHIQAYYEYKMTLGKINGQGGGLKPKSIKQHHTVLKQAFNLKIAKKIFKDRNLDNPMDDSFIPRASEIKKSSAKYYSAEKVKELLRKLEGDRFYYVVAVTVFFGLRRSELLGIKWNAVDIKGRKLSIEHVVVQNGKIFEKDSTKNGSSHRTYPLDDTMLALFIELKQLEENDRKTYGEQYIENDYVFKWDDGRKYQPNYISRNFKRTLQEFGLPHIRFHDLRHSCASILYDLGYDIKDISEWLGHSDIKITADIYTHLMSRRKLTISQSFSSQAGMLNERARHNA